MKGCCRSYCADVAHCMVPNNCGRFPLEPVLLARRRDLCPTCEGKPALCYDPVTDTWCPTCGGHGFVDECDADFKKRMHEAMRTTAGAQEKPLGYFERTIRDGCTDE